MRSGGLQQLPAPRAQEPRRLISALLTALSRGTTPLLMIILVALVWPKILAAGIVITFVGGLGYLGSRIPPTTAAPTADPRGFPDHPALES